MLITVFTPLYNREKSIRDVYNSLMSQTNKAFEWLVVNDGSTDHSGEIMEDIIAHHDGSFPIQYFQKRNEGLNRTINKGLDWARGDLFFRVDSDDVALPNAVELIQKNYHMIQNNPQLCALVFRPLHFDGTPVGFHPYKDITISDFCTYRYMDGGTGDRSEVVKIEVFRKYKFPEFEGEKFCSEGVVWNRMSNKYKCVYFSDAIYKKGFVDDSITSNIYLTLKRSCRGAALVYYEWMMHEIIPYKERLSLAVRYYRYAFFAKSNIIKGIPLKLVIPALPIGLLIIVRDYIKYPKAFCSSKEL